MIQNYLISNCLLIIEEMNQRFERYSTDEITQFATAGFDESDLVFLLAYPFRNLMKVSMQGKNQDIIINNLDFVIEVKYLYATKASSGNYTNKRKFDESFMKDFRWLKNNIEENNKGKRAYIIGWFNIYDSFSKIMQLGQNPGINSDVNKERLIYFPFLFINQTSKVQDIKYRYYDNTIYDETLYKPSTINLPDLESGRINCIFLGKESDIFHFAIYY